jgi:hypothetical protein
MRRSLIRILYLSGLGVILLGVILLLVSFASGATTTTNAYGGTTTTPNNVALFVAAIGIICLGAIPVLVAWIGALVRTAQLQEWVWFVLLLVFQGVTLLAYVIAGPDQPRQTAPLYRDGARAPTPPS